MQITNFTPVSASIGGILIGLAATLYLLTDGRYAGISGMVRSVAFAGDPDRPLDTLFVVGLIVGGVAWLAVGHGVVAAPKLENLWIVGIGGTLVGFGTALGRGCTSGHGVCGLGRLSGMSLVAVATFLGTGIVTVFVLRHVFGVA